MLLTVDLLGFFNDEGNPGDCMKKVLSLILVIVIAVLPAACGAQNTTFTFKYQSKDHDYETEMYYDDSLFSQPSTVYDPSLSTASMSFAMASFGSMAEEDYSKKSVNASDLLKSMGFDEIRTNSFFQKKPEPDSLGCVFGQKKIDGHPMIACGIRGSNYGAEWASNITVGTDEKYHQGFFEGSEIFLNSLRDYIDETGVTGEIRLWIVGYSRAGAVCNIAAGRIDEAIHQKEHILGAAVALTKEGLYAYCFEAPQGVCYDDTLYPKSEIFNNIFCIVNHNDCVPKTPMQDFSFTRYGVDKVLFSRLNDIRYDEDIAETVAQFGRYENAEILGSYIVDGFEMKQFSGRSMIASDDYCNWSQGLFLDDFLSQLALYGLKDRDSYAAEMQPGLRELMAYVFAQASQSTSLVDLGLALAQMLLQNGSAELLLDDLLHNPTKLITDGSAVLNDALEALGVDVDLDSVKNAAKKLLSSLAGALIHSAEFSMLLPLFSKENILCIAQAHQPELTLAFLRSLDPQYSNDPVDYDLSGRYYFIEIDDSSADVVVLCKDKEIVKFESGKPVGVGSSVPYASHKTLRIYLPYHESYTVTSSSERISVKLYEPSRIGYTDCQLNAEQMEEGYRITIPAA